MIKLLAVGIGGFIGAILRYWMTGWVYSLLKGTFPTGTLVVNLAGSFVLGFFVGYSEHIIMHPAVRLWVTIGILGAFTTFSTFSYETVVLLQMSSYARALLNIFLSVFLGLLAAYLGLSAGRAL